MKVGITGANGYIGRTLVRELSQFYEVVPIMRVDMDLTDSTSVNNYFNNNTFDVLIHTAIKGGSRLQKETYSDLDHNLKMYYNLLDNRNCFGRFISIGSGAELYSTHTPYGLSKHVIRQSLLVKENFYNLRVFAVFDEDELNSRFIKNNIVNHIRGHDMIIHQNKYMDFFYMKDFCSVVNHYISAIEPPKEYDCSYEHTLSLVEIAEHINTLGTNKVDISIIAPGVGHHYSADYPRVPLPLDFVGLTTGITNVYNTLLCKK